MVSELKKNSSRLILESIIGCKWSLGVIDSIRQKVIRPGEMKRFIPGISEKVLNERLKKLVRFKLVIRKIFPVSPPRVEYRFTAKGRRFLKILDALDEFSKS
ncbi:MAG: DNA-binding HxlR family transcriptional regulator [Candidatus Omnitrophota bacterium]|jgi:DNA-binding HxlR family transcriptional regulator